MSEGGVSLPGVLMIGGGVVLTYAGIQDPQGGPVGVVRSVLSGQMPRPGAQSPWRGLAGTVADGITGGLDAAGGPGAAGGGTAGGPDRPGVSGTSASAVISAAQAYLGTPYRLGGASLKGIDCSGLTMMAYRAVGRKLPHLAAGQSVMGTRIPNSQAAPGDLIFWGGIGTAFHVALIVGPDQIIAAPTWGRVVEYQKAFKTINGYSPFVRRLL